jgi:multiple sugar transport system permease protein
MVNSIFVASSVTIVALFLHSMAGFSFAVLRFKGRIIIFYIIVATMMIPFTVRLIPLFIIVRFFGWANSYYALIIPPLFHAYGIFFFRQFYLTIPTDLKEAAIIDGCSIVRIWTKIYLPLSRPIIAVLGTIFFLVTYNDFIWPLVIINNPKLKVIQVGLADFVAKRGTHWDIMIAGTAFAAVPTIIIFFFMQRQLVQGIKMSGLKG